MLFYYTSLSVLLLTWISQNFVFLAYANQKLRRKNLWGRVGSTSPPPVTEGLRFLKFEEKFLNLRQMLHLGTDGFFDTCNLGRNMEQRICTVFTLITELFSVKGLLVNIFSIPIWALIILSYAIWHFTHRQQHSSTWIARSRFE